MHDHRGHRVHAGAAVFGRDRQAQEAQLGRPTQERHVQGLFLVVFFGLGLDLALHEVGDHLAQESMLFRRLEQHGPRLAQRAAWFKTWCGE
jgi:hypothetical protein